MSLDLEQLVSRVASMADRIKAGEPQKQARLDLACETLKAWSERPQDLQAKGERSQGRTPWLIPGIGSEGLPLSVPLPTVPRSYLALATDGSHIAVDRHRSASCYLINIGRVSLSYGSSPDAALSGSPALYFEEDQMVLPSPLPGQDGVRVEGPVLGARRAVEECRALANMVEWLRGDLPAVALLDGSLILWDLEQQRYPDFVAQALICDGLVKCIDDVEKAVAGRRVAFGSYISAPRATEVVNLLRVAICPHESADCDGECRGTPKQQRVCDALGGMPDAALFARVLRPGERSATFVSHSRVVDRHYGRHTVCFFYLHVGDEVARIETPAWVADRPDLLQVMQALVFEQCRLGDGYPVALAEAHEQAVVTAADREQFWRLVDAELDRQAVEVAGSAKSRSKKRPFV